ncbi:DUF4292 domain-containing protein [Flavobacterium sp. ASW18X]|uniref:DUF4292 domain-containing protein n=1 Tax=Flavobacterium sp. ASW18X TaxID=2572595 RepID=UPI0010AE531F|nr:DUF4292 domain-containing protein [Flavobacterium sp. ASW18X]TKD65056.1 DUF4292 domain-containing protein [Flavobacterium sp. ASW18X]
MKLIKQITGYNVAIILLLLLGSCGAKRAVATGEVDANLTAKKVIQQHYQNQLNFTTLTAKVKIDYSKGDESQGVSVSLRMKKDDAILLSAPFGMFKALITPDRVSFYNKLENEYFDGDFEYLSKLLGTEMDFNKVQNLLVGDAILDLKQDKYQVQLVENTYKLTPKQQKALYEIFFYLKPNTFKIAKQEVKQSIKNRKLDMRYTYQDVASKVLPSTVDILVLEGQEKTTINLEYKNVELGKSVNFPYKIPTGFKEISL